MIRALVAHLRRLRRYGSLPAVTSTVASLADHYATLGHLRDRRLALLAGANLLDTMSISIIVPLLPTYAESLGAGAFLIGLIFAAESAAKATLSAPFGHLTDRTNRRVWIVVGTIVSALSVMAFGLVEVPLWFVGLRLIDGAATAMRGPATTAYIGDAFPERDRGGAIGAYRTAGMLGLAVGPALGGGLAVVTTPAVPFVVLGAGTLIAGIVLAVGLPKARGRDDIEGDADTDRETPPLRRLSFERIRRATSTSMIALAISVFVAQIGTGAFSPFLSVLLKHTLDVGPGYTGMAWSAFGLAMLVFTPLGGSLADTTGRKRTLIAGKVTWSVVTLGLAVATAPTLPVALLFAGGIASAFSGPALGALQYEVAPDQFEGTLIGVYSSVASAGIALGPILGGLVADRLGVVAVFVAIGALWLLDTLTIGIGVREPRINSDTSESTDAGTAG